MTITQPAPNTEVQIAADPTWPSIVIQTDATGPHTWNWTIAWKSFTQSGTDTTTGNQWDAQKAVSDLGGTLTVTATAGGKSASVSIKIKGQNPTLAQLTAYLANRANSDGFDSVLNHETKCVHFNKDGEPVKSFDNGYGMAQLTTPPPKFDQVWNWKKNVDGGLTLFAAKRAEAMQYLAQSKRTYTPGQLKYETVCRWNGGRYHVWDTKTGAWVRNPDILCDSKTGNIGWDMTDDENKGKTEADLRSRDKAEYSKKPGAAAHWKYSGVCYADAILG